MADKPGRRQQPFRFWFPSWSSPSRPSQRPPRKPQPQPPTTASQFPASQSSSPSSQAPATTEPQHDDARTETPLPLPSPTPSRRLMKVPSSSRSGRRESLPLQAIQAEPPTAQGDSHELAYELGNQVGKPETQLALTSLPQEEKPSQPSKIIDVETLQNLQTKTLPTDPLEGDAITTRQSLQVQDISTEGSKDETKTEPESKQFTEAEEPQKDPEVEPDSRNQTQSSEARMEQIREEKPERDVEAELEQDMSPIRIASTRKITEESHSKEGESERVEAPKENPCNQVSEEPKNVTEPNLSITVSDSTPTSYHQRNREFSSIAEPDKPEEPANGALKESMRHSSTVKGRKITISTMPHASSPNSERPSMQKELKDGLSRLVQKLSIGHQNKFGNEQGVSIITLASENKGASMFIGCEGLRGEVPIHIPKGQKVGKSTATEEENYHNENIQNPSIAASINSNVQGINSSILDETTYSERNPGVHMTISTKPTAPVGITGKTESPTTKKATSSITSPQKLTYEPNIRRRCLRGLLKESSEDDMKNPQKPRRHGCRFTCDDKKEEEGEETGTLSDIIAQ